MRQLIAMLAALSLAGCASTPAVRGLADKTGLFVTSLRDGTSSFLDAQNNLNSVNAARLDQMVANGTEDRANVRQQRLVWVDSGDTVRLATHDAATSRSAEEIDANIELKPLAFPTVSAASLAGYSSALKALADVTAKPKPLDQVRELIAFGQAIKDDYAELKDKIKKDADGAVADAGAKDISAKTSGDAAAQPK